MRKLSESYKPTFAICPKCNEVFEDDMQTAEAALDYPKASYMSAAKCPNGCATALRRGFKSEEDAIKVLAVENGNLPEAEEARAQRWPYPLCPASTASTAQALQPLWQTTQ